MAINNASSSTELEELASTDKNKLVGPELATAFDIDDRFFVDYKTSDVYETKDPKARQLKAMLSKDGTAKKLEQILTLPIRSANYEIRGTGPAGDFLREVMGDLLDRIIDQCSIATIYKKTFFEKIFKLDGSNIIYDQVAWRPPIACEAAFDKITAKPNGFRQRLALPGGVWLATYAKSRGDIPGYVSIPRVKSFIYTHGTYRDPLLGISDMDVAVQAYETKEKLKFLWFEFLENQSRPKLVVYDNDMHSATTLAESFAKLKGAGVMGMRRPPDPAMRAFDTIEPHNSNPDQFIEAIRYLEQQQTNSVLAGFTDLTQSASGGPGGAKGSYALSDSSSEYFLASRQAVADEISYQVGADLFGPLVALNFGADVEIPELTIGPIGNQQTDRALTLLTTLAGAPTLNVPPTFLDQLLTYTSSFLGLSQDEVEKAVEGWRQEQDQQKAQMQEQMKINADAIAQGGQPGQPLKPAGVQPQPGRPQPQQGQPKALSNISTAVDATTYLVNAANAGIDPKDAVKTLRPKPRGQYVNVRKPPDPKEPAPSGRIELGAHTWTESLHPRVPGHHGRESGRFTDGTGGSGGSTEATPEHLSASLAGKASHAEVGTTPALNELAGKHGATMVGLNHRIKEHDSLTRKIGADAAEKGISHAEAASAIVDALRYTMVTSNEKYHETVQNVAHALREKGYKFAKIKNTWGPNSPYRGMNTQVEDSSGFKFELQFHTSDSFSTKQEIHKGYSEARQMSKSDPKRMSIESGMAKRSAQLQEPGDTRSIDFGIGQHHGGW